MPSLGTTTERRYANLRENVDWENDHFGCRVIRYNFQRESQDSGQGRHSTRPTASDFRRKATRGWSNSCRLQYPKGVYSSPGSSTERRYADFRENSHWEDHYLGCGVLRYYIQCEGQDSRQGRYSSRSAASHLCWKTVGGWANTCGLQHPEGVYSSLGTSTERRTVGRPNLPQEVKRGLIKIKDRWDFPKF